MAGQTGAATVVPMLLAVSVLSAGACSGTKPRHKGACPRIYSREEWGAREPVQESASIPDSLPYVFVHHTAMGECNNFDTCMQRVQEVQNLHMDGNNWWDIGYSFLIGGDGSIFAGRGWNVQGAHTGGFNTRGYGICFLGDFTDRTVSQPAEQAYFDLVSCMTTRKKIAGDFQMFGHRQTKPAGGTECPGNTFFETIKAWNHWTACTVEDEGCLSA